MVNMITLEEARLLQKKNQIKVITNFLFFTALIALGTFLLFKFTDILTRNSVYYLVPIALLILTIYKTGLSELFTKKEFIGVVIKNEIFPADEKKVKRGGFDALQDKHLVAEIIVKSDEGKTMLRTFYNGPITTNLVEGDKVAILRFISHPVVIKGKYWKISN